MPKFVVEFWRRPIDAIRCDPSTLYEFWRRQQFFLIQHKHITTTERALLEHYTKVIQSDIQNFGCVIAHILRPQSQHKGA